MPYGTGLDAASAGNLIGQYNRQRDLADARQQQQRAQFAGAGNALASAAGGYMAEQQAKQAVKAHAASLGIDPNDPGLEDPQTAAQMISEKLHQRDVGEGQAFQAKLQQAGFAHSAGMQSAAQDYGRQMQDSGFQNAQAARTNEFSRQDAERTRQGQQLGQLLGPGEMQTGPPPLGLTLPGAAPSTPEDIAQRVGQGAAKGIAYDPAVAAQAQQMLTRGQPRQTDPSLSDYRSRMAGVAEQNATTAAGAQALRAQSAAAPKPWQAMTREEKVAYASDVAKATRDERVSPYIREQLTQGHIELEAAQDLMKGGSDAKVEAAKAKLDALLAQLPGAPGAKTAPPVQSAAPSGATPAATAGPTQQDLQDADAAGLRWDPAQNGFVPK